MTSSFDLPWKHEPQQEHSFPQAWPRMGSRFVLLLVVALLLSACSSEKPPEALPLTEQDLKGSQEYSAFDKACTEEDYTAALRAAREIAKRHPQSGVAWCWVGYAAEREGDLAEALRAFQKAVEVEPKLAKAWYNLGVSWSWRNNSLEEVKAYEMAVKLNPRYAKAWRNLASAYADWGRLHSAEAAFRRAIRLDPSLDDRGSIPSLVQDGFDTITAPLEPTTIFSTSSNRLESIDPILFWTQTELRPSLPLLSWDHPEVHAFVLRRCLEKPNHLLMAGVARPSIRERVRAFETDPIRRAKRLNNRGMLHEHWGEWDFAEECYREALRVLPREAMIWNNLGLVLQRNGKFRESLNAFREADRLSGHEPATVRNLALGHYALAIALQAEGLWEPAMDHLREALSIEPRLPLARFHLIVLHQRLRNWRAMIEESQTLLKEQPDSGEAWHAMAIAYSALAEKPRMLNALRQAVRLGSRRNDIIHWYAIELALAKHYDESISHFDRYLRSEPKDGKAWYHLGLTQAMANQPAKAVASLERAKTFWTNSPQPKLALAAAYEQNLQPDRAVQEYRELLLNHEKQAHLWKFLASASMQAMDWQSASEAFQKALAIEPRDFEVWLGLGYCLGELAQNRQAEEAYHMAIERGEKSSFVWNNLGVIQARRGAYDQALESFQKALNYQRNDPDVLLNMGLVYHQARRFSEAQNTHLTLRRIHPEKAAELWQFMNRAH